jgi:hypothetical protein
MSKLEIPADLAALAEERALARQARDWATADELKARIEAAGWRIVDDGVDFTLSPLRPPDRQVDGVTWYGSPEAVPSALDEPASRAASIIVLQPPAAGPAGWLGELAEQLPADVEVLVVAAAADAVDGPAAEFIRTVEPWGPVAALRAGVRRSRGELVVVLQGDRRVTGDIVGPLQAALADETVAIAGTEGLVSGDLRRYQPAEQPEATALGAGCYAFRRADGAAVGRVDPRLHLAGSVATWLSLELRDRGPDAPPRRALAVPLPISTGDRGPLADDHARLARRDAYRLADRFRQHGWLAEGLPPEGRFVGDGAGEDDEHDQPDQRDDAGDT